MYFPVDKDVVNLSILTPLGGVPYVQQVIRIDARCFGEF
jgi:hypothetical protein